MLVINLLTLFHILYILNMCNLFFYAFVKLKPDEYTIRPLMSMRNIVQAKDDLIHTWLGDENNNKSPTSFVIPLKLARLALIEGANKYQQDSQWAITAPDWLQE